MDIFWGILVCIGVFRTSIYRTLLFKHAIIPEEVPKKMHLTPSESGGGSGGNLRPLLEKQYLQMWIVLILENWIGLIKRTTNVFSYR